LASGLTRRLNPASPLLISVFFIGGFTAEGAPLEPAQPRFRAS
jgi:hypothetical protein